MDGGVGGRFDIGAGRIKSAKVFRKGDRLTLVNKKRTPAKKLAQIGRLIKRLNVDGLQLQASRRYPSLEAIHKSFTPNLQLRHSEAFVPELV